MLQISTRLFSDGCRSRSATITLNFLSWCFNVSYQKEKTFKMSLWSLTHLRAASETPRADTFLPKWLNSFPKCEQIETTSRTICPAHLYSPHMAHEGVERHNGFKICLASHSSPAARWTNHFHPLKEAAAALWESSATINSTGLEKVINMVAYWWKCPDNMWAQL